MLCSNVSQQLSATYFSIPVTIKVTIKVIPTTVKGKPETKHILKYLSDFSRADWFRAMNMYDGQKAQTIEMMWNC